MRHSGGQPSPVLPHRWCALLCLVLTVTGCSQSYNGERLFWKAQHVAVPLLKAGQIPPEQLTKAVHAFELVAKETPGTVWAARAQLAIGTLYTSQQQYSKARDAYAQILQNYNQYQALCLSARLAMAKGYEKENQWEEAVKVYEDISDYHPWTGVGMEAPLYIGRTYEERHEPERATSAYERATRRYIRMIPEAPNPDLASQIKSYLALAYQRLSQWDAAIETLEGLAHAGTPGINRPLVLFTIGSIYQTKLNNLDKAKEIYAQLVQEFPEHPFGKVAKTQLQQLGGGSIPQPVSTSKPLSP